MAVIDWGKAKHLLVVDPFTGLQIPHVKAADPEASYLECYSTTACAPFEGMEMLLVEKQPDGSEVTEKVWYTFVSMRDGLGRRSYLSTGAGGAFDLVNKYTGEVEFESRSQRQVPLRFRDPAAYWHGAKIGRTQMGSVFDIRGEVDAEPLDDQLIDVATRY
jgi:hypothetical protein